MSSTENNISTKLQELFQDQEKKMQGVKEFEKLERANSIYNEMLERGLIKKRGYTLLTITDRPVPLKFNGR